MALFEGRPTHYRKVPAVLFDLPLFLTLLNVFVTLGKGGGYIPGI